MIPMLICRNKMKWLKANKNPQKATSAEVCSTLGSRKIPFLIASNYSNLASQSNGNVAPAPVQGADSANVKSILQLNRSSALHAVNITAVTLYYLPLVELTPSSTKEPIESPI